MNQTLNIETEDVYEAPILAEAGDFAHSTQGEHQEDAEGSGTFDFDF